MPVKALPPPKPVPFFFVNDTSVSATWYFNSTDPGVSGGSDVVPGGIFGAKNYVLPGIRAASIISTSGNTART